MSEAKCTLADNTLVSIVVPVYNREKYLDRCLTSLINQTYKNLEIILVDDGSKDKSGEICDRYALIDDRIITIHQKNGGVSKARNTGIDAAHGKYIAFVDADDFISENMYELLVSAAEENASNQVCCNAFDVLENKTIEVKHFFDDNCVKGNEEVFSQLIKSLLIPECADNKALLLQQIWNKLYLRKLVEKYNIRFDTELRYAEDWLFNINFYRYADNVKFISDHLYYYFRPTEESLSKTFVWESFDNTVKLRKIERTWFPDFCPEEKYNILILDKQIHYLKSYVTYNGYKHFKKCTQYLYNHNELKAVYHNTASFPSKFKIANMCFRHNENRMCKIIYHIWCVFCAGKSAVKFYLKRIINKITQKR